MSFPKEIQIFFNEVVDRIKTELDPDFILIAGSFGKGSWLYNNDDLISDFELVFVKSKKWSLSKKKALLKALNEAYPFEISLKGYLLKHLENKAISNYSNEYQGFLSLDFFDTFSDPNILYTKHNDAINVSCKNNELPVWESWRLFINRIGDILDVSSKDTIDNIVKKYYWLKLLESCADCYLIIVQKYHKDIENRLDQFTYDLLENDILLSDECKESFGEITSALVARKQHKLEEFEFSDFNLSLIYNWLLYFEKRLVAEENIDTSKSFHFGYLKNKKLHSKYLGVNKIFQNVISLGYNRELVKSKFKFYNVFLGWRHLILLSISSAFQETYRDAKHYDITKSILVKLFYANEIKSLQDNNIVDFTVNYWKKLR